MSSPAWFTSSARMLASLVLAGRKWRSNAGTETSAIAYRYPTRLWAGWLPSGPLITDDNRPVVHANALSRIAAPRPGLTCAILAHVPARAPVVARGGFAPLD